MSQQLFTPMGHVIVNYHHIIRKELSDMQVFNESGYAFNLKGLLCELVDLATLQ